MKRITIILLVALAVVAAFTMCQAQDPAEKPDLEKLQLRLQIINQTVANARVRIDRNTTRIDLLNQQNAILEAQIPGLRAQAQELVKQIQALQPPAEPEEGNAEATVKSKE